MGKNIAIITAGGSGKRFASSQKKQFCLLEDRPILFWTIDNFLQYKKIDKIIITLPKEEFQEISQQIICEYKTDKFAFVRGGKERQDSVYNALSICPSQTEYVFIHDGVRPFITVAEIKKLHEFAIRKKAVVPAFKVKNTIKQVDENVVVKTLPRQELIAVLTPQVFKYDLIWSCHQKAKKENLICTDDAALLENYSYAVHWLECSSQNIKITEPFDKQIAITIMKNEMEKNK